MDHRLGLLQPGRAIDQGVTHLDEFRSAVDEFAAGALQVVLPVVRSSRCRVELLLQTRCRSGEHVHVPAKVMDRLFARGIFGNAGRRQLAIPEVRQQAVGHAIQRVSRILVGGVRRPGARQRDVSHQRLGIVQHACVGERHTCKVAGCVDALLEVRGDHEVVEAIAGQCVEQALLVEVGAAECARGRFRSERRVDQGNTRIAVEVVGAEHERSALLHQPAQGSDEEQRVPRHLQPAEAEGDVEPAAHRLLDAVDAVRDEVHVGIEILLQSINDASLRSRHTNDTMGAARFGMEAEHAIRAADVDDVLAVEVDALHGPPDRQRRPATVLRAGVAPAVDRECVFDVLGRDGIERERSARLPERHVGRQAGVAGPDHARGNAVIVELVAEIPLGVQHLFEQRLRCGRGVANLPVDLDGRHAHLLENLGHDPFAGPLEDAAEVGGEILLPTDLPALQEEGAEGMRCRTVGIRRDGLVEKLGEAVALHLRRKVALAPAKLHLVAPERLQPGQRVPHEAEEKFLLFLVGELDVRRPVVKCARLVRGDAHLADRLPHAVARRAAHVEEDGVREDEGHGHVAWEGVAEAAP